MSNISENAMLTRLTVNQWGGRAIDRVITEQVARENQVSQTVGRYNKDLVPKAALEPINKVVSKARLYNYEVTLPWLDDGARILPAALFFEHKRKMGEFKDEFESAVYQFSNEYESIKSEARTMLNSLYREGDYPTDIGRLFRFRVGTLPLPNADDFRVGLGSEEVARLRISIESDVQAAFDAAQKDCWDRAHKVVSAMVEKLGAYKVDETTGKQAGIFRDSLVENIRDLVGYLPGLNFTGDSSLERLTQRMSESLVGHDAQELRDNPTVRESVLRDAESILADMAGYCS